MSFREKKAWLTLVAILLVFTLFVLHVPRVFDAAPDPGAFHVLLLAILAFIVIEVVGLVILRLRYPEDARTPRDERERRIDQRAEVIAGRCYVLLSLLAILSVHHGANAFVLGYFIVFAFALSQMVNQGARIWFYRRET